MSEFKEVPESEGFDWGKFGRCVKHCKYPVYFLLTQKGDSIEVHISAKGREGKRGIREASVDFLEWVPRVYPWCKMLLAPVAVKSVYNLCIRFGFIDLGLAQFERGLASVMVKKL